MTYGELAIALGQSQSTASIVAAILSDGRGQQPGLRLLKRVSGRDRREKCVLPSRTGLAVAKLFASGTEAAQSDAGCPEGGAGHLQERVLPALRIVRQEAGDEINLTVFSVFLYIVERNEEFAVGGSPASTIADALRISNLPRNLARLSDSQSGLGWIMLKKSELDRRLTLPFLTELGLKIGANIAACLAGKVPTTVVAKKTGDGEGAGDVADHEIPVDVISVPDSSSKYLSTTGSTRISDAVAAYMFDLELLGPRSEHDAISRDGRAVEIKSPQGRSVSLKFKPDQLLVLHRSKSGEVDVIYNGPGDAVWQKAGLPAKDGSRSITVAQLRRIDAVLDIDERLPQVRDRPPFS